MKSLTYVLIAVGFLLLVIAVVGRFVGQPHIVMGVAPKTVIEVANSAFAIAILSKLFEKK